MHQCNRRHPLGQVLLAAGLVGISAVGYGEAPLSVAAKTAEQQVPYQIPVPRETVAVAAITQKGDVRIIAVSEDGKAVRPAVCEIKGRKECPFKFPEVVTTIEIGKVNYEPHAKVEPIPGVAYAASGTRPCVFAIKVGNKVYYYVAPCTP